MDDCKEQIAHTEIVVKEETVTNIVAAVGCPRFLRLAPCQIGRSDSSLHCIKLRIKI